MDGDSIPAATEIVTLKTRYWCGVVGVSFKVSPENGGGRGVCEIQSLIARSYHLEGKLYLIYTIDVQ